VYHRCETLLKCHQCGFQQPAPDFCPTCGSGTIAYKGTAIQKAEHFLHERFPHARILRMDRDTTRRKHGHVSILREFAGGRADILLGTQMVAKGLDFPRVTLVGVLQADIGLCIPDFRSSERTFQLLSQVAGRAGRSENPGEVVIQTYSPDNPGILAAQQHDFIRFYSSEIEHRRQLYYPPFSRLLRILILAHDNNLAKQMAGKIHRAVQPLLSPTVTRLGPAPATIERIQGMFRYSLLFKSTRSKSFISILACIRSAIPSLHPDRVKIVVDIDPVNML